MTTAHHCCVHDHQDINVRLDDAKQLCQAQGGRFTNLREDVYRLILQADKPLGAYDLINALQQIRNQSPKDTDKTSANIAPPTVYRTLEFLLEFGLIHQLSSINAYIPCCHPRDTHIAGFLICEKCRHVQELSNPPVSQIVEFSQSQAHFQVRKSTIELSGLCQNCQSA